MEYPVFYAMDWCRDGRKQVDLLVQPEMILWNTHLWHEIRSMVRIGTGVFHHREHLSNNTPNSTNIHRGRWISTLISRLDNHQWRRKSSACNASRSSQECLEREEDTIQSIQRIDADDLSSWLTRGEWRITGRTSLFISFSSAVLLPFIDLPMTDTDERKRFLSFCLLEIRDRKYTASIADDL